MVQLYLKFFILLISPIFVINTPIDLTPPYKLYNENSIISNIENLELSNSSLEKAVQYRLPNNTIPISYNIKLRTDVHDGKKPFTGINIITLKVNESDTNQITIHGREIKITSAELIEKETKKPITLKDFPRVPDKENEFLVFELASGSLEQIEYILTLEYTGELRTDNGGFYLSKYEEGDEIRYLATTQFESTDARHGFPCYDEPGIKAKFTISITHHKTYTALSNMPVTKTQAPTPKEEIPKDYVVTTFEETKDMSTYLVAFVVSKFDSNEKLDKIPHRVYSRPETKDERNFALESSVKILTELEKYLKVDYSFPKMDQISIPDFAAGAMENWGLVTYREEMLLYNSTKSTTRTQTVVANTIAHEYGHQWFGNLVSPKWWKYLWLNEGFASLFAYIGVDLVYHDWDIMEHFMVAEYQRALKADEGINKRPMTYYVDKRYEIVGLFDSVSYSKAACVINMMRHYLGEDVFKKSLNNYLNNMKFKSATEEDLFQAFQGGAKILGKKLNITIEELMGSWTRQGGFPLITVKRNYDEDTFEIKQEGFKRNEETGEDKRKWNVPYNFVFGNNPNFEDTKPTDILVDEKKTIKIDEKDTKDHWLLLNKQLSNYYRVNYDEKNWDLIIKQLMEDPSKIHKYNRAQLISDSFRLSLLDKITITKFFDLMEYLPKENDYAPWSGVDEAYQFYKQLFHDNENIYGRLQFFILKNIEKIYEKLGVKDKDDDNHFDKYIRSIAINWACISGSEKCLKNTNERLNELVVHGNEIEPNLQAVIYCNGLKKEGEEFSYLLQRLNNSNDQAERQLIIGTLGCTYNTKYLRQFVDISIDGKTLKEQEKINILRTVFGRSKEGFEVTVEFLKEKYKEYAELKPQFSSVNPLQDAIVTMSTVVASEKQKKLMTELMEKVGKHPDITDNVKKLVETNVDNTLKWLDKNSKPVKDSLDDFYKRNSAAQVVLSFMALFAVIFVSIKNAL